MKPPDTTKGISHIKSIETPGHTPFIGFDVFEKVTAQKITTFMASGRLLGNWPLRRSHWRRSSATFVLRLQVINQAGESALSDHISRKELKQDKIHDAIEHGAEAFYLHKQITFAILTAVLLGAIAWGSWSIYHDRQTAAATVALDAAMKAYNGRIGGAPDPQDPTDVSNKDGRGRSNMPLI